MVIPESIKKFVDAFSALPGVGPRQAIRLAFHIIHQGPAFQTELTKAISSLKTIVPCRYCFYMSQPGTDACAICDDAKRNHRVITVVEKQSDLLSLENTRKLNSRYLVLGELRKTGILEPEQKLRLQSLKKWIQESLDGSADEIILAINPTPHGDVFTSLIIRELQQYAKKVSRIGRGIPTGGEIEFADEETLTEALTRRG